MQVLDFAPDVLLLSPCSRSPAAAMPDVKLLAQKPGFNSLPAVQTGRVYVVDHGFFSRPGPRLWDGIGLLAALLYGIPAGFALHGNSRVSGSHCHDGGTTTSVGDERVQVQAVEEVLLQEHSGQEWQPVLRLSITAAGTGQHDGECGR